MRVIIADDEPTMRSRLMAAIDHLEAPFDCVKVCGVAENGAELIAAVEQATAIDLVISDVRMPEMDGLSSLVYLRSKYPALKIILLSSETSVSIQGAGQAAGNAENAENAAKYELLDKIAARICRQENEPGKINSILAGCEKLAMAPCAVARHFGAQGFVRKPISTAKLKTLLSRLERTCDFIKINKEG